MTAREISTYIPSHAGWTRLVKELARFSTRLSLQPSLVMSTGNLRTFAGRMAGRWSCMTGTARQPARKQRWPAPRPRSSPELTCRALRQSTRANAFSTRIKVRGVVPSRRTSSGPHGPLASGYEHSTRRTTASCAAATPRNSPTRRGSVFAGRPCNSAGGRPMSGGIAPQNKVAVRRFPLVSPRRARTLFRCVSGWRWALLRLVRDSPVAAHQAPSSEACR